MPTAPVELVPALRLALAATLMYWPLCRCGETGIGEWLWGDRNGEKDMGRRMQGVGYGETGRGIRVWGEGCGERGGRSTIQVR
jgi:hypothetical protein